MISFILKINYPLEINLRNTNPKEYLKLNDMMKED